jgi:DegV family protein with EDD domain
MVKGEKSMPVRIVTDSTCDLPEETIAQHDIRVVPLYVNVGDQSYLDGVQLSREAFYTQLPDYAVPPTTSVPGPDVLRGLYEELADEGATEIVSIHIAESLSAFVNTARMAAQATQAVPVTVFDGGQITTGTGLIALAAAKAAAEGQSAAEIVDQLKDLRRRTHAFAALDTLEFLRRSGRLSRLQFGLGALLSVKPLLKMHDGQVDMERVRTNNRSIERLIGLVEALGPLEDLAVVHTNAAEKAKALRQQARHLFPTGADPLFAWVTPVIGAHVGPGAVGLVAVTQPTS